MVHARRQRRLMTDVARQIDDGDAVGEISSALSPRLPAPAAPLATWRVKSGQFDQIQHC
jgi:hypothetical protein